MGLLGLLSIIILYTDSFKKLYSSAEIFARPGVSLEGFAKPGILFKIKA